MTGLPRSKGVILERVSTLQHDLSTTDMREGRTEEAGVRKNRIYNVKLRAPLMNTPQLKLVAGVSATIEEYVFDEPMRLSDPLLVSLEDRPLRTAGIDLYALKSFRSNKYLVTRLQTRLNGDFDGGDGRLIDYARFSLVSVIGWKLDEERVVGLGAAFNHIYGRATILPVVIYYNSFHPKWGVEANLPANARLRFSPKPNTFLYLGSEVRGANYRLDPTEISSPYILEKSALDIGLTYEREIHDWLWMGAKVGSRQNLSLEVSSSRQLGFVPQDRLLESEVDNAWYYGISVFLVAPKKMLNK